MESKYLISRLLSGRDQLSRPEKDALRDSILAAAAPRRRRRAWAGGALALAGAAALLLLLPRGGEGPAGPGEFAARGGDAVAAFDLACPSSGRAACEQGETMVFDVRSAAGYEHFAAFARRGDGAVIWYVPEREGGEALPLAEAGGVLDRGVVLGAEHPPGRYEVYGVFSEEPLTRDAIVARFDPSDPSAGAGASVVARELVVN